MMTLEAAPNTDRGALLSQPLDPFVSPLHGCTLIEASAGTGKTWAISALVLRLLLEKGLPIGAVLVVTFTKAATAELRERIRARLMEAKAVLGAGMAPAAEAADPLVHGVLQAALRVHSESTVAQRLAAALASFDEAAIFTIHGFCQRALGDVPLTAGQPFELRLGEDQDVVRQVTTDYWRQHIATITDPLWADYLARTLSPDQLAQQLQRRLARPLAVYRWPEAVSIPLATAQAAIQAALTRLQAYPAAAWESAEQDLQAALADKVLNGRNYSAASIREGRLTWQDWLAGAPGQGSVSDRGQRWCADYLRDKTNKAQLGRTPTGPLFDDCSAAWQALQAQAAALAAMRLSVLRDFLDTAPGMVARRKREQRQASFDDLLANVHGALHGPAGNDLAASLRGRYPAALIDEFQDTDPLQFGIFQRVYPPDSTHPDVQTALFLVGDPKQAIYSFRQADLQTYLYARQFADRCYYLPDNQRSSAALIGAVNALFQQHANPFMQEGLGFLPVGKGARPRAVLRDDRAVRRAPMQCWQWSSGAEVLDKSAAFALAADTCAREIADLLRGAQLGRVARCWPDGREQALQPQDIAVLVRTNEQGRRVKAALGKLGIGAAELATGSVFAAPEAAWLMRWLTALAEPSRQARLRAALASPGFGLDAQALAILADGGTHAGLAWVDWLARFQAGQQSWLRHGLAVMLYRRLSAWGIAEKLLAQPEGERQLTNLMHLMELLHEQERLQGRVDPAATLRWLAQQQRAPYALGEAAQLRLESDAHLVRILTIHRAKGLEFPVVFCPFLGEGPGRAHPGLEGTEYPEMNSAGHAVRCVDFRASDHPDVLAGQQRARLETAAEQLRLIYVALTRAVDRCYVVAGAYLSSNRLKAAQRAYLHWLVMGDATVDNWLEDGAEMAAIEAAWARLAEQVPAWGMEDLACVWASLPTDALRTGPAEDANDRALARPEGLTQAWRMDSFSGLLRGGGGASQGAVADRDVPRLPPPDSPTAELPEEDILWFERGARAGECIHAVFEHCQFDDPATWSLAVRQALRLHPPTPQQRPTSPVALSEARLMHMLADVLQTPLPGVRGSEAGRSPFALAHLPATQRWTELEFCLPVGRLTDEGLQRLCARYHVPVPSLGFAPLQGYLRGFIDLVFRVRQDSGRDRYFVLDWKSNFLGPRPEDYASAAMEAEMLHHGYYLQALIYSVALHRHLQATLPDYQPAEDLGGALYLFVRGMRGATSDTGVLHWVPPVGLLNELSDALGDSDA